MSLKEIKVLKGFSKTHICKINCKDGSYGTGFFCNIPFGWNNYLKVLMTSNHILNEKDIQPGQTINFSIDNDFKKYSIIIDNNRLTYINKSFDVTIIETKKYDKINEKSFFDLDKQIFQENAYSILKNNQIYLLHYPKGNEMEISPGIIQNITIDNTKIEHLCSSSGGSLGAPLINKNTHQVLGIHKGEKGKKYNIGTLLKEPIEKFKEEIKTKNIDIEKYIQENENIEIEEKKEIMNGENKWEEIT